MTFSQLYSHFMMEPPVTWRQGTKVGQKEPGKLEHKSLLIKGGTVMGVGRENEAKDMVSWRKGSISMYSLD